MQLPYVRQRDARACMLLSDFSHSPLESATLADLHVCMPLISGGATIRAELFSFQSHAKYINS